MSNLPIPGNPVAEIGTAVVKEGLQGLFSCMKHAETERTNRAAIRKQVDEYVADVESDTKKVIKDLEGMYAKHNKTLDLLFFDLQNAKTEEQHDKTLDRIISFATRSALADTEAQRANKNFGNEKEVYDAET